MYQECLSNLSNQLITHYNLNTNQSVDVNETFSDVAASIYQAAKYDVSESYKENGDYYVDVTIYPLDILSQSYDEILSYIEAFNKDVADGVYNDVTKEVYNEKICFRHCFDSFCQRGKPGVQGCGCRKSPHYR